MSLFIFLSTAFISILSSFVFIKFNKISFLKYSTPLSVVTLFYLVLKLDLFVINFECSYFCLQLISLFSIFGFLVSFLLLQSIIPKYIFFRKKNRIEKGFFKFASIKLFILLGIFVVNLLWITVEVLIENLNLPEVVTSSIVFLAAFILIFLYMNYYPGILNLFYGKQKEIPENISNLISDLSKRSKLKIKKFTIVKSTSLKTANAWTYGLISKKIVVTDYLIKHLSLEELETVIAHEIGHAKKNHTWVYLALMLIFIPIFNLVLFCVESVTDIFEFTFFTYISLLGIYYLLVIRSVSRVLEYKADAYIYEIASNPNAFISAITKITMLSSSKKKYSKFQILFLTHPPLEERVKHYRKNTRSMSTPD